MKTTDMVEELFYGRLDPAQIQHKRGSDYWQTYDEIGRLIKRMEQLTGKEEADQLDNAVVDLEGIVSRDFFSIGFRWGAKMAFSIFEQEPDTLTMEPNKP